MEWAPKQIGRVKNSNNLLQFSLWPPHALAKFEEQDAKN